jgi:hypothetical protein
MKDNKYKGSSILAQNSKMRKTSKMNDVRLFSFGIPAFKTEDGRVTCPFADACIKFCYAQKGAYSWKNVKPAFERRYELTKDPQFIYIMSRAIRAVRATHIRIHDSGDFYSVSYLHQWMDIIRNNKDVSFYFYTKSVPLVQDYQFALRLPSNLNAVYSFGGKKDDLININNDSHSVIFDTKEELYAAGYVDCSKDDLRVFTTRKVGLIMH